MPAIKGKILIDGGEGFIYEDPDTPNLLMKIYKEKDLSGAPIVTSELHSKLEYMKSNPPEALVSKGVVAWPLELITDDGGKLLGFVMPRMNYDEHIQRTYSYRHPKLEAEEYNKFPSVESRIKIAMNLCSALNELHIKGYVFGDLNHHNVGVNYQTGQIYFMDCDSLHLTTGNGAVYRTSVIMAGYLAPEIIRHCNNERSKGRGYNLDNVALPTFTKESDLFCLAIHIFKLLMNGISPFLGIKDDATGSTASPFVGNEAIERNSYVFREGNRPAAVFCLPAEALPFEIITLLNRAFLDGAKVQYLRPDAAAWYNALNRFLNTGLIQCAREAKHQYYNQLTECPYCAADERHHAEQVGVPVQAFTSESASLPVVPIAQQTSAQPPQVQQSPPQLPQPNSGLGIIDRINNGETRNLKFGKYNWRVLERRAYLNLALLITEQIVDTRQYSKNTGATTWEKCSLREYLNDDFYYSAFTDVQRKSIIAIELENMKNRWYETPGGADTLDYIFLLSLYEVDKYFGNSGDYQGMIKTNNLRLSNKFDADRAVIEPWWLRSPGSSKANVAFVTGGGTVYVSGNPANIKAMGVRPALMLDLS